MTYKQREIPNEIIALDFYDGATEGLVLSLDEIGSCYFKLIAWDASQDRRLFVVVSISKLVFDTLFTLLSYCNSSSPTKIWLPNWEFRNVQDEKEANKLLESCKANLNATAILYLGKHIDSKDADKYAIRDSLVGAVEGAMQNTESLEDWLVKINQI